MPVPDARLARAQLAALNAATRKAAERLPIPATGHVEDIVIGNVVNLASRFCSSAESGLILVDLAIANAGREVLPLPPLGTRPLKGSDGDAPVFSVLYGQGTRELSRGAAPV